MDKWKIYLIGSIIITILLFFVGYEYIRYSSGLKNQLRGDVKSLIDEARSIYIYISDGGNNPVIDQEDLSRILIVDSNINTKEKILEFMQKTYTKNAAKRIYNDFGYEDVDGKLFKSITDCVLIYDWNEASIEGIKINPLNKNATVIFTVTNPMLNDKEKVKFELIKSRENTYKIDNIVGRW